MGKSKNVTAIQGLISALADNDENVHLAAVKGIAGIGKAAVSSLIEVLDSTQARVRYGAVNALGEIGLPAVQELKKTLRNRKNAWMVAAAPGRIGNPEVIAAVFQHGRRHTKKHTSSLSTQIPKS